MLVDLADHLLIQSGDTLTDLIVGGSPVFLHL